MIAYVPPHAHACLQVSGVSSTLFNCFSSGFRKPGLQSWGEKKGQKKEERATRKGGGPLSNGLVGDSKGARAREKNAARKGPESAARPPSPSGPPLDTP